MQGRISSYQSLDADVLQRAPQSCNHCFPSTEVFKQWKYTWHERICLLWLQGEGKDWEYIIKWFENRGTSKGYGALHEQWVRASDDVSSILGDSQDMC
jgi:hypothetical protein